MRKPWRGAMVSALSLVGVALIGAGCTTHPSTLPGTSTSSTTHPTTTSTSVATTPGAASSTSSTAPGSTTCTSLSATLGQSQGAAGTITGTINIVDTGGSPCTMEGYPTLALFSAGGSSLPVTMVDGLTVDISGPANGPPTSIVISPSQGADFTYQYSDVPSGTETACPSSATVSVTAPGATGGTTPVPLVLSPCDNGTIRVSPVYPGG